MNSRHYRQPPPPVQLCLQGLLDLPETHPLTPEAVMPPITEAARTRCLPLLADLLLAVISQETGKEGPSHE